VIVNEYAIPVPRMWTFRVGALCLAFVDCFMCDEGDGRHRFTAVRVGPVLVSWRPGWPAISWCGWGQR
jgi:hypothetical protein